MAIRGIVLRWDAQRAVVGTWRFYRCFVYFGGGHVE